jgi:hypothetical protein
MKLCFVSLCLLATRLASPDFSMTLRHLTVAARCSELLTRSQMLLLAGSNALR